MPGSVASKNSSNSEWGSRDPRLSVMGVHTTVLGGWPVWPLVLHKLVMAGDCQAYVDCHLVNTDFSPLPMTPGLGGWRFLDEVRRGYEIN